MKKIFIFLSIALSCLFSACSSTGITTDNPLVETNGATAKNNAFLDYGDFSGYITEDNDILTWRILQQKSRPILNAYKLKHIDPNAPMIALTFDDGPSAHTDRLLDIFKTYGGKGTFFVVGNTIDKRQETLKRISNEGHEIGNHSWSHVQLTTIDEKKLVSEIMKTREKVYELTGKDSHIVRPPYGSYNDTLKKVGKKLGVCYVNWSVDSLDWQSKDALSICTEIANHVNNGAIILCHDLHKTTVDSMEQIIPQLLKQGYQLVTVSELLYFSENPTESGNMYYRQ